jgi:hypothetical protein
VTSQSSFGTIRDQERGRLDRGPEMFNGPDTEGKTIAALGGKPGFTGCFCSTYCSSNLTEYQEGSEYRI